MVWPDRRPKPAMWEHKRLAAPVRIAGEAADLLRGRVEIANHQHFRDLGWLRARYSLTADGTEIAGGAFDLPALGPGERATVELPGWVAPTQGSGEAFLTVRVTTAEASGWAPQGFEVCAVQVPVVEGRADVVDPVAAIDPGGTVTVDDEGLLQHPALAAPPTLALWRAPTDNDRIGGMAARWSRAGVDRLQRHLADIDRHDSVIVVRSVYTTAAGIEIAHEATYTPLSGRRDLGRRDRRDPRRPRRPAARRDRARAARPVTRPCAGSVPGRTRHTPIASVAA